MPKRYSTTERALAWAAALLLTAMVGACANHRSRADYAEPLAAEPYEEDTILREAESFFGRGAQGLADVLNRAFRDNGPPDAYIKGEEGGGAVGLGLRYGRGTLYLKDGTSMTIYWRGPSIGIDFGGSAAKTFVLIYRLPAVGSLFQRFGGVEGSLYYVGGIGMNYNRSEDVVLAPVRFGVGWRQGISVGYLHLSPERSWIPF
jgi:hypothetical protein